MEINKAIRILTEERNRRHESVLSEDRVITDPLVEAIDTVIAELKALLQQG